MQIYLDSKVDLHLLCKNHIDHVDRKLERNYRQTGCRKATTSPLLYILEKNFTHLRIYKEIKQLTRQ